ncbi:MAG: NUDIX hydrolase [Clostridia bacterium]|nr:NUDIX hydrolase [Clostridia bacterium]
MKTLVINKDNLKEEEVVDTVTRVKCFIENGVGEVMLASTQGGCMMLPGGHVEEGEDLTIAAQREVQEETGIVLGGEDFIAPFFEIKDYIKNYRGRGINRIARMIYFHIRTDKQVDLSNTNMTEEEKSMGFFTTFVSPDSMREMLEKNIEHNEEEIYRVISFETLRALNEFQSYKSTSSKK